MAKGKANSKEKPIVWAEFNQALELTQNNERYAIAKKTGLPVGRRAAKVTWQGLAVLAIKRLIELIDSGDVESFAVLKRKELEHKILVLDQRLQKMKMENEERQEHLVDIRELRMKLAEGAQVLRDLGDDLGRKSKVSGRDAQEMINAAIDSYRRKLLDGSTD